MSKISFELHLTIGNPIYINFEEDIKMNECYEQIISHVNACTIIDKDTILDVFVENKNQKEILSLKTEENMSIKHFILKNESYFPIMSMSESMYKVFVIDKMYFYNKNNLHTPSYNAPPIKREIKTNHWSTFVENIKKNFVTIYI